MLENLGKGLSIKSLVTMLKIGVPMALSWTFSDTVVTIGAMSGHAPGNNQNNLASGALIMGMLSSLVSIAQASMYAMNIYANSRLGQLQGKLKIIAERGMDAPISPQEANELIVLRREISAVLKAGILFGLPSVPLPMLSMYFSEWILTGFFKQDPVIAGLAQRFLRPYSFALTMIALCRMPIEQILFSFEEQFAVMGLALLSFSIGTVAAYLFCFTFDFGLSGAAYGYLIEAMLTPLLFGLYLAHSSKFQDFNFFASLFTCPNLGQDWPRIKELARSGLPILLTVATQVIVPLLFDVLAGKLPNSKEALAVQSFSSWLTFGVLILGMAIGQGIAQETNRSRGRALKMEGEFGCYETSRFARGAVAGLGVLVLPICLVAMIHPKFIIGMMSNPDRTDPRVIPLAETTIRITAAGLVFDVLGNAMVQCLRSLNDNAVPSVIAITGLWLGLFFGALLGYKAELGVPGLAMGYLISNIMINAFILPRFLKKTRPEALAVVAHPVAESSAATLWCCHHQSAGVPDDEVVQYLLGGVDR